MNGTPIAIEGPALSRRSFNAGMILLAALLGEFAFALLMLPLVQRYLPSTRHLGLALPGYLLAAYGFARLVLQIPLGALADMLDRRLAFGLGYLAVLAAGLAFWPAVPPAILLLAAVVYGLGHALADPLVSVALAVDTESSEHGRIFSYLNIAQVVGLVLGLAGGAFIVDLTPVAVGFLLVAGANTLALVLLLAAPAGHRHAVAAVHADTETAPTPRSALIGERVLYLFAVFFAIALASNLVTPDLSPFITQRLHTSLHVMTLYLAPAVLAGLLALPLGGWLTDHYGRLPPLLAGSAAAALAFGLLAHLDRPWQGSIVALFAVGGLALTMPAATAALVDEADPRHRGLVFGSMMAAQGLAEAIGPFFGAVLIAGAGAAAPFAAAAIATWVAIPISVLYASAPRAGRPGVVVGYTPLTRALSRMSLFVHALYLPRTDSRANSGSLVERETRRR